MIKQTFNSNLNPNSAKSTARVIFEYALLGICLCVVALGPTLTENPVSQLAKQNNLTGLIYSSTMSAVLIMAFLLWLVAAIFSKNFSYRSTNMEIGLCIFILAAAISGFAAADKRTAIISFTTLIAPILMCILLVQLLDSKWKIKLLLTIIAAVGIVSGWQCSEQFFYWHKQDIKFYEQNSETVLAAQNIAPGSLQQWQFEHRLNSKGTSGFFTTSNSAGSFAILAGFAGLALLLDRFKNRNNNSNWLFGFLTGAAAVAIIISGLVLTHSKGAIAAAAIAAFMLTAYLLFGSTSSPQVGGWLGKHKKTVLLICILLFLAASGAIVTYGVMHDRLPGGNSMLVRWQYWKASLEMYTAHFLTGVGAGNFADFYTQYKPAAAAETVADPHNFPLSILAQYGAIGLIGFLIIIFAPLQMAAFAKGENSIKNDKDESSFVKMTICFAAVISIAMLIIRPAVLNMSSSGSAGEQNAVAIILYIIPVAIFVIGLLLLMAQPVKRETENGKRETVITAVLFCGVLGVIIHNIIDFAIFERAVTTTFFAIIAAMLASIQNQKPQSVIQIKSGKFTKITAAIITVIIVFVYFNYCLIPPIKATAKISESMKAASADLAHKYLGQANQYDKLSPAAATLNGKFYLQQYNQTQSNKTDLLIQAEKYLLIAIERNKADFKNYEKLADVYGLLAEAEPKNKNHWLNKAFESSSAAIEKYPGHARLRITLAKIAEKLGKTDTACQQYKKAIEIEDSYRRQFEIMYPGQEIISRLGQRDYDKAKQQIKHLSEKLTP